ncbi:hypothetical protein DIPPA_00938 [Diplonema papillatum]|nr:hypothetical protein DIPPA_00938 [Diplonema papillatum]
MKGAGNSSCYFFFFLLLTNGLNGVSSGMERGSPAKQGRGAAIDCGHCRIGVYSRAMRARPYTSKHDSCSWWVPTVFGPSSSTRKYR